jgi:hypothetical protein
MAHSQNTTSQRQLVALVPARFRVARHWVRIFKLAQRYLRRALEPATWLRFFKPPTLSRIGFVAQNDRFRKAGFAKNAFSSPFESELLKIPCRPRMAPPH